MLTYPSGAGSLLHAAAVHAFQLLAVRNEEQRRPRGDTNWSKDDVQVIGWPKGYMSHGFLLWYGECNYGFLGGLIRVLLWWFCHSLVSVIMSSYGHG